MKLPIKTFAAAVSLAVVTAACTSAAPQDTPPSDATTSTLAAVLETVSPHDAAAVIESEPEGLVVLDVRTPEEFSGGRLAGAVNLDFYAEDFATSLDGLDKSVPYVIYCRSGNRSGQTLDLMRRQGFSVVRDVAGGIIDWSAAGLPVESQ